jgi:hypothetical protein
MVSVFAFVADNQLVDAVLLAADVATALFAILRCHVFTLVTVQRQLS